MRQNMYCFFTYTEDTCSTKPNHELDILQHQYQDHLGICQCYYSVVVSNISSRSCSHEGLVQAKCVRAASWVLLGEFQVIDFGYFSNFEVFHASGPFHIHRQHRFVQDEPQLEGA